MDTDMNDEIMIKYSDLRDDAFFWGISKGPFKETAANSVCKIQHLANGISSGTGFLCRIEVPMGREIKVLCTSHVVVNCYQDFYISFKRPAGAKWKIRRDDIRWLFTDPELNVTFLEFTREMTNAFCKRGHTFLFLSDTEPIENGKIAVVQHTNDNEQTVAEGSITQCNNKLFFNGKKQFDMYYTASTLHGSSGSPVLDEYYDVIGIHKGSVSKSENVVLNCGTIMKRAYQKIVACHPWENPESYRRIPLDQSLKLKEINVCKTGLLEDSICKISYLRNNETHAGNGFLCEFSFQGYKPICGMLTCNHVLNCEPNDILVTFSKNKTFRISNDIHVRWFKTYPTLHFTFIHFKKVFVEELWKTQQFLPVAKHKPLFTSKAFILYYPENVERPLITTERVVQQYNNIHLFHDGEILPGEAGSPILNEYNEILGIRNVCYEYYNIGTLVTHDSSVMERLIQAVAEFITQPAE